MALTNRRWTLAAVLGMALLAAAYLPPAEVTSRFRLAYEVGGPADRRFVVSRTHLAAALEETALAAEIADLRDGRIRFATGRHGVSTEVRGDPAPGEAEAFASGVESIWRGVVPADSGLRLRVVAWHDAPADRGLGGRSDPALDRVRVVPPAGTDGRTCLLLLPYVSTDDNAGMYALKVNGIGPCLLYAAFGAPGRAVGRWIRQTDYDLALESSWATGDSALGYRWWYGPRAGSPALEEFYRVLSPLFGVVNPAYEGGVGSAACAAGAAEACRRVLLDTLFRHDPAVSRGSPGAALSERTYFGGHGRIGPVSGRWVNDLIQERGRERFGAFWRSDAPPDSAFRSVYGLSMEDWTTGWMRKQYGEVTSGAGLTLRLALMALLGSGLTLLVAALGSRWRTLD